MRRLKTHTRLFIGKRRQPSLEGTVTGAVLISLVRAPRTQEYV